VSVIVAILTIWLVCLIGVALVFFLEARQPQLTDADIYDIQRTGRITFYHTSAR